VEYFRIPVAVAETIRYNRLPGVAIRAAPDLAAVGSCTSVIGTVDGAGIQKALEFKHVIDILVGSIVKTIRDHIFPTRRAFTEDLDALAALIPGSRK